MRVIEVFVLATDTFLIGEYTIFAGSASEAVQLYEDLLKCSRAN